MVCTVCSLQSAWSAFWGDPWNFGYILVVNAFEWDTIEHYKRSLKGLLCSWTLAYLMGVDKTWTPPSGSPSGPLNFFSEKEKE